jgi:hypothetical protein
MEIKYQSTLGGRVALSRRIEPVEMVRCERHIETTTNQNNFAYIVVSIRRTNAAYSTSGVFHETN